MLKKCVAAFFTFTIVITLVPQQATAQSTDRAMPMRTPDGQPDISGIFTFRTLTPFQRPREFEGKENLTAEEAAAFEASERRRLNRDLFDPEAGARSAGYQPRSEGGVLSYNEFWYERGIELTSDKRTSLVIDPPDGRLPPQTEEAEQRGRERAADADEHRYDSYENRSLADRCIMGFNSGPPMRSSAYNNNVHILQAPGYVVLLNEMVHNTRVVPLDDRQLLPPFPQFAGVSRGHWQGETLVVETTPLPRRTERWHRPEHAPDRALHAHRPRHGCLRVYRHGSDRIHGALHRDDAAAATRWRALRVRVPRGQHRPAWHSRRGARTGAAGSRAAPLVVCLTDS